jgi:hypothetical protein
VSDVPLQDRVGLQPDRLPVTLRLQQRHQLGRGERGIAPEELGDLAAGLHREGTAPDTLEVDGVIDLGVGTVAAGLGKET